MTSYFFFQGLGCYVPGLFVMFENISYFHYTQIALGQVVVLLVSLEPWSFFFKFPGSEHGFGKSSPTGFFLLVGDLPFPPWPSKNSLLSLDGLLFHQAVFPCRGF